MGATLRQNEDTLFPVTLTDSGAPVTGLVEADVTVELLKADSNVFVAKTTWEVGDLIEIGAGLYHVSLVGVEDLDSIGIILFKFTKNIAGPGNTFDPVTDDVSVIPKSVDALASPKSCKLFGNILDLSLQIPNTQVPVNLRIVEQPYQTGDYVVTSDRVQTVTNAQGAFEMYLPRLAVVVLDIDEVGIRKQFTVPDQDSVSLIDVLNF